MASPKLDENTVYLIDGSGYIFRAFFAVRPLHSRAGVPTNAVYGFCTMLIKLLRTHKPKYLAIAFDVKGKNFRHEIYSEYKANRLAPPEDLVPQFDLIQRLVKALNIKRLVKEGFEADDLIATVAQRAKKAGHEVVVVTGDKDLMQLVDEKTFLLDELRASKIGAEQFIDEKEVKETLGVWPNQVCDLLALAGDTSDNIPGVAGIGKKTAAELIHEFGSLEKIFEYAPLIKQNARRQKLIDGHKIAMLSKKLVGLDYHAPIDCDMSDMIYQGIDQQATLELFKELDFNRLLSDETLFKKNGAQVPHAPMPQNRPQAKTQSYLTITNKEALASLMKRLAQAPKIAIDTETDGLDTMTANLVGISLAWAAHEAAYIPLGHRQDAVGAQLDLALVRSALNAVLADTSKVFVAQNAKFDHKVLTRHGFTPFKIGGDPMLASYLLHQDQERHNLDDLSQKYLNHKPIAFTHVVNKENGRQSFADVPLDEACAYAAEDADLAWQLATVLESELALKKLDKLYHELELPLEEVLSSMEMCGVSIDEKELADLGQDLNDRIKALENRAHEVAGVAFNLASPKQVGHILFEKLALPAVKKTKTGFSTDSAVLEKLKDAHELPQILLEHRMYSKLINTYVDVLPKLVNVNTGRIHTSYNQFVTATGRLSSSDPNLQNIPIKTTEGRRIRQAFVAAPGCTLISLDYSQIELRLLAYVSQDPLLVDSFAKSQDVHVRTASEIFEISTKEVSKEQRNIAKTINFGLLYGMGAQRLSQTLGIPRKDAQGFLEKYFQRYAGIVAWKEAALKTAKETGEVRTLFGRLRAVPELFSKNPLLYSRGERLAINTPIQGSQADIIKKAMIDTHNHLKNHYEGSSLILQVHDELVIEAKIADAATIAKDVAKIMSHGHGLKLDLKVEYGMANNWGDAH